MILLIGIILTILFLPFCEKSKRWGFFAPQIWIILLFTIFKFYKDIGIIVLPVLLIGLFSILFFILCVVESAIRIFNSEFVFFQKHKDKKLERALKAIGRYPGQLDMYNIFPKLRDNIEYQIIYNHCNNNEELLEFTYDWKEYFLDLQSTIYLNPNLKPDNLYFSFDEWYEKNQRWKCTSYHKLYYQKQASNYYNSQEEKSGENHKQKNEKENSKWFQGITNFDELKKRYKDLLKIYHPDNHAGDNSVTQEIQGEYERILKMKNWE